MPQPYTSKDCSTPSTRRPLLDYVTPHDRLVRGLLDEESYTLDTFRINNGSNYVARRSRSENAQMDYTVFGGVELIPLTTPEEYDDNLQYEEECTQGDCANKPPVSRRVCTNC